VLHQLERGAGRRRGEEIRWGPRTLDLDLLLFEGVTCEGPNLVLPHPRMWERAFVTVPLRELLERSPRFQQPVWASVRKRLADVVASPDVVPWSPPRT
jgi:2-amino-4-hydroxy-6-hydroxymethyldihydropteridine diphosphokinase